MHTLWKSLTDIDNMAYSLLWQALQILGECMGEDRETCMLRIVAPRQNNCLQYVHIFHRAIARSTVADRVSRLSSTPWCRAHQKHQFFALRQVRGLLTCLCMALSS